MKIIYDAGALVAMERKQKRFAMVLAQFWKPGTRALTHGGVLAQVWRGGHGRQAPLAKGLAEVDVAALDEALGRKAGELLARSGTADVIDAAVVLLASDGDVVLTSDPIDLAALAQAAGLDLRLVAV